jgi:hypothetical protein
MNKHKYPLVRVRSALAAQLVQDPADLPATVNAFIELCLEGDAWTEIELTPVQRKKLMDYAKAAKLESASDVVTLLIKKGLPALWWDLELKKGKTQSN